MQYLAIGIRCLLGAVFLFSSFSKVWIKGGFDEFRMSVDGMRLVPSKLVGPVALSVVTGEVTVCLLLAGPAPAAVAGLALALALLIIFTIAIVASMRRGIHAPCRCFGVSSTPLGPRHIARNVVLASAAVLGVTGAVEAGPPPHAAGVAVALVGGFLLGGLVTLLDDIFDLFQPLDTGLGGPRRPPLS